MYRKIKTSIVQYKLENDTRDYYQEYVKYINERWKGIDNYDQRLHTHALEFCKQAGITFEINGEDLIFDATNGLYKGE